MLLLKVRIMKKRDTGRQTFLEGLDLWLFVEGFFVKNLCPQKDKKKSTNKVPFFYL